MAAGQDATGQDCRPSPRDRTAYVIAVSSCFRCVGGSPTSQRLPMGCYGRARMARSSPVQASSNRSSTTSNPAAPPKYGSGTWSYFARKVPRGPCLAPVADGEESLVPREESDTQVSRAAMTVCHVRTCIACGSRYMHVTRGDRQESHLAADRRLAPIA